MWSRILTDPYPGQGIMLQIDVIHIFQLLKEPFGDRMLKLRAFFFRGTKVLWLASQEAGDDKLRSVTTVR